MKFKRLIKEFIPPVLLKLIKNRKIVGKNFEKENPSLFCPVCESKLSHFKRLDDYYFEQYDRYQYIHSIFQAETMNILRYNCPVCNCIDRNRLYALFLHKQFEQLAKKNKIVSFLDIAPDKNLTAWIKKFSFINYRSVDLMMEGTDDKADITDLNIYENERFDIILCSHVLEHVENDRKAMAELNRILKPGGFAILMVPILLSIEKDLENPAYQNEADRWKYYGQNDHVRMYSKMGFIRKLEETGFKVNQFDIGYFGSDIFEKHGIHSRSVLYTVEK